MDRLIREIETALGARMWLISLQGTLALVDIAAALQSPDGRTTGAKFKSWFEAHLGETYPLLSSEDMWLLRCGMLHQGRTASKNYDAVIFTLPDGRGNLFHNNIMNQTLQLDLVKFCSDVTAAVETWWATNDHLEPVATNAKDLVRVRQDGMAPYIVGVPILA